MSDHYYIKQVLNKPDAEAVSLLAELLPELRTIFLIDGLIEQSDYDDLASQLSAVEEESERLMDEKEELEDQVSDLEDQLAEAQHEIKMLEDSRADLIDEIGRLKGELAGGSHD